MPIRNLTIGHESSNFFIKDLTHVMLKVMIPIMCLKNLSSKVTGTSSMLCQVQCYVKFHVMLTQITTASSIL